MAIETKIAINKLKMNNNTQFKYEAAKAINDIASKQIQKVTTEEKQKLKHLQKLNKKLKENIILHIKRTKEIVWY